MKKASILIAALLVSVSVLGGTAAHAATYGSNGEITFIQDTDPTEPGNPEEPGKPVEPVDPTDPEGPGEGTAGPLSIDYASSFQFGNQKISTKTETYNAQLQKYNGETPDGPNYVQVTDKTGEYTGWNLTVTQGSQFKQGEKELKGAKLSLKNITANSINLGNGEDAIAGEDITNLVPGTASPVGSAESGKGKGTWTMRFGADAEEAKTSVQLEVPGTANPEKGKYDTELTWTLTQGPTA
ncbi:WxL domain-containing protein [Enterococcus sp. 669A]|uniref:WxL domain-containing protein n=1 Tax=Candidatus Enterococcus moelleringii TaxID=2815325 RepID=A0ABS3LAR8_9ENTE|nr:WxL domain-containing protein [Enterococcus sp. 669A]MBO1306727.1 WxL domain-containing protein [Enterococcus sp. 669A]